MTEIKKLGWAGVWFAFAIFTAGFMAGDIFNQVTRPVSSLSPSSP